MLRNILIATSALVATLPATGQTALTDLREVCAVLDLASTTTYGDYGYLRSLPNGGADFARLRWLYPTPGSPGEFTPYDLTLPMHRVGSLELLPSGKCLVVGRRFTAGGPDFVGMLALVSFNVSAPSFTVIASADIGAIDPLGVCYDADGQHLFLIDAAERSIVAASWSGVGALPTAFAMVTDHAAFDGLDRPRFVDLRSVSYEDGVRVYANDRVRYTRFTSSGSSWTASSNEWLAGLTRPVVRLPSRFVPKNGTWDFEVFGPATFPMTVNLLAEGDVSEALVLTGSSTSISAPAGLVAPGDFGSIDSVTIEEVDIRTCLRFGEAQNTSFFPFGELYCDLYGPWVGRNDFVVSADVLVHETSGTELAIELTGALRIASAPVGGPYPVTLDGTAAVLTPTLTKPLALAAGVLPTDLSFRIPTIPASAEGLVLLFQVVVTDGTQSASTDVFGIQVRPSDPWADV